jgi:tetratricopeptide (TPR) repeat protein
VNGVVLHSGYDTSVEGQLRKRARDAELLMLDYEERPEHPFTRFNLGMTAFFTGEHEKAVDWLQRSLEVSDPSESHVRALYSLMAKARNELGDLEAAAQTFREGLAIVGEDPDLRFGLGAVLARQGKLLEAKQQFLGIQEDISGHYSSIDIGILGFKRFAKLGEICRQLGEYKESTFWFQKAAELGCGPAAIALFEMSFENEDYRGASASLDQIRACMGPCEEWAVLGTQLTTRLGQSPLEFLRTACRQYSYATGPRLAFARLLLDQGLVQQAEPHLNFLDEMGSAEAAYFLGVTETRRGNVDGAIEFTKRACERDPGYDLPRCQLEALERLKASML